MPATAAAAGHYKGGSLLLIKRKFRIANVHKSSTPIGEVISCNISGVNFNLIYRRPVV